MKHTTFAIGALNFSVQTDPRTGTPYVHSIHPYDETEYHWARREPLKSSTREWRVYRKGRQVCTIWVDGAQPGEYELIARKLLNLDNEAHLTRRGGIW